MKKILYTLFVAVMFLVSCNTDTSDPSVPQPPAPEYNQVTNWIINAQGTDTYGVDVFYMLPTSWMPVNGDTNLYCDVNNPLLRERAPGIAGLHTSIFEGYANIYAPYYRQADANRLPIGNADAVYAMEELPYSDVERAFEYFLEHYNKNRPFIIAGHSQGTLCGYLLLRNYLRSHPEVQKRMISAYMIGYALTKDDLAKYPNMKLAQGADDVGTIITYNTEAPVVLGNTPTILTNTVCINPVNWRTDATPATKEQSLGSYMPTADGNGYERVDHFADAQINLERGTVMTNISITYDKRPLFPLGTYHGLDYNIYYYDLKKNVGVRIESFMKQK